MKGEEITSDPTYYQIHIDLPADKYSFEEIEKIAEQIHILLGDSQIYHTKPDIINLYE